MHYDTFDESLSALDDSEETMEALSLLLARARERPEVGKKSDDNLRVLVTKTTSRPGVAALRLYYALDDKTLSLLCIEAYDELAD